jgi:hypothetical protein
VDDAYAACDRLTSSPHGTERGLSSLEGRLAKLAVSARRNPPGLAALFQTLAGDASKSGYTELSFEIRLAEAGLGHASEARTLELEATALGYGSVASRARKAKDCNSTPNSPSTNLPVLFGRRSIFHIKCHLRWNSERNPGPVFTTTAIPRLSLSTELWVSDQAYNEYGSVNDKQV